VNVIEKKLVNTLREQFERLLIGEPAQPVDIDTSEDADVVSLAGILNRFITEYNAVREFSSALASGNLDESPLPRNLLASPFKQLHAALRHLTWQTERIAKGDYSQRVHFMGDFSNAFNSMVKALAMSEAQLNSANEELRVQGEELQAQSEELQAQNEELDAQNEELDAQNGELAQLWEKTVQAEQALQKANEGLEIQVRQRTAELLEKDIILIQQNRMAALGEMFEHIAHQWQQPLNSIALIIQTLGSSSAHEQVTTKEILETVDIVMDMVGHMAQTVDVFRNFYRPDKEKTVFLVKESIEKALSFVKPALRRYGIEVDLDADSELSTFGYPKEYAQVLLNILGNAKDAFMERGMKNPRISIKALADGDNTVVTITDNAGGIPYGNLERIFDLYFTTKELSGGTGIGLYMSKNIIVKNMGGKLSVRNSDNGAQFRIELANPDVLPLSSLSQRREISGIHSAAPALSGVNPRTI
jgi:C4-dicarboxylate-specific signal transduction histidine kinase